ncbi:sensor histidine kinase [Marinicrinis sediminis]|uniref:histidine kinase n=1 Tax=Marinicrinis sediminis TaxID=1652465 RepID=A0ABW5R7B8_9BACL
MNAIQKKIIFLSFTIWIFMAGTWMFLSYHNEHTIEKYHDILNRYLFLKETASLSNQSLTTLNEFILNENHQRALDHAWFKEELRMKQKRLYQISNSDNYTMIRHYEGMIESQLEEMDLVIRSISSNQDDAVMTHFVEASNISKYVSEMTLSLVNQDLETYETFYREMMSQSKQLKQLGFWILVVASIMLLLFSYSFSMSITRPINKLTYAAKRMAKGHLMEPVRVRTNDEFSFLAHTFNQMRISIRHSIQELEKTAKVERELQEHKLLLRESEIKSLQSQINPHFLFNTLNTLSKKAYLEGAEETSELISSVSTLLRYNLRQLDRPVTIRKEIEGLQEYLLIQKARFMDRIHYELDIDPACLDITVPALTIQPFVENAFVHAIEPLEEGGSLYIRVRDAGETALIEIEDTGIGMSEEQIDQIVSGEQVPIRQASTSTGIGTANVIKRLRLHYQQEDIIAIHSEQGKGTIVQLRLPKKLEYKGGSRYDDSHSNRG